MQNDDNIENKKHIETTYSEKAMTLLKICMGISGFSIFTYFIAIFFYNSFDFGLIFEVISFIFLVIAFNNINRHHLDLGKRNVIISMIPIGWLIIYDFINLLVNIKEVLIEVTAYYLSPDRYFYVIEPYLYDVFLVTIITLLFKTYTSLCKADGSKKDDTYVDTFYDKL